MKYSSVIANDYYNQSFETENSGVSTYVAGKVTGVNEREYTKDGTKKKMCNVVVLTGQYTTRITVFKSKEELKFDKDVDIVAKVSPSLSVDKEGKKAYINYTAFDNDIAVMPN